MRVNVYAEEMTDQIEIISKVIDGQQFTGLRIYLHLPVSQCSNFVPTAKSTEGMHQEVFDLAVGQVRGPFIHRPGDDDSSAVTFWGKKDLRNVLRQALEKLDEHYSHYNTEAQEVRHD